MKTLLTILLLTLSVGANAELFELTWVAPVEREDNTTLTVDEISHFNVRNSVDGSVVVENIAGTLTSYTHNFPFGQHNVVMTTVDIDGRESIYSQIITVNAAASPKPVTGFQAKRVMQ